jgi:DNA-binding CsgD family transcriptional regulator
LLVKGKRSKEVAAALGISPRTAEGHRRQVLRKMEVSSTAELATAWLTQQPTTPPNSSQSST